MDQRERTRILERLEGFFEMSVARVIEHLVAQVKHNIPRAERAVLYGQFLKAIASIARIEGLQLNEEAREHLSELAAHQTRQLSDLDLLRRCVAALEEREDLRQEGEIQSVERDFLYSLKHEIAQERTGR